MLDVLVAEIEQVFCQKVNRDHLKMSKHNVTFWTHFDAFDDMIT